VDREIEQMIYGGALTSDIEDAAARGGTVLLKHQSLQKVAQQVTSVEEALRVVAHG
jgi:type II secretory ATPase GspE/PulE/Tfp pilus assembly ATPase PilB-like protein